MINKLYSIIIKIYGNEEKWKKSRLRKVTHPIVVWGIANIKSSTFYMVYNRGLFYENATARICKRKPLNGIEKIIFLRDLFRITVPQLECNVGLVCTLRCQKCNQCNYMLKDKHFFDVEKMIDNLHKIFNSVDYIHSVSIAGGEALGAPQIEKIINCIVSSEKVGSLVVVTNGTIFPTEEVFEALHHPRIELSISNYPLVGEFRENRERLYLECEKRGINVNNNNEVDQWTDIGEPYNRKKTNLDEKNTYANCWLKDVLTLIDGKVFRCEKIYILDKLGVRKLKPDDYIDVNKCNGKQLRKALRRVYRIHTLDACNYCNSPEDRTIIPSGIQAED